MRFTLALILFFTDALAADVPCAPVDLSARLGPVRNQYATDWCVSTVAAELLSYQVGTRVALISVATNYYVGRSGLEARAIRALLGLAEEELGAALLPSALRLNLRHPVCPEAEIPDRTLRREAARVAGDIKAQRRRGLDPPACAHPIDTRALAVKVSGRDWPPRRNLRAIRRQLLARNPVAAVVEADLLLRGARAKAPWTARWLGDHVVTVAGQREVDRRCRYLVRNTWGPQCLDVDAPGVLSCEAGQMWVEEAHLRRALKNIIYLEP